MPSGSLMLNLQLMLRSVTLRPIRSSSPLPSAMTLQLSSTIVPFVAIVGSSMSRSWNFNSPPGPNLPKNPETLVNPGTTLGRLLRRERCVLSTNADPCRPLFKPPLRRALKAASRLSRPTIWGNICLLFVEKWGRPAWLRGSSSQQPLLTAVVLPGNCTHFCTHVPRHVVLLCGYLACS